MKELENICREMMEVFGRGQYDSMVEGVINALMNRPKLREELRDELERRAVREVVHRIQHQDNRKAKRGIETQQKAGYIAGAVARTATAALMDSLTICGKVIGDVQGSELDGLADANDRLANGYARNAQLLRLLRPHVPEDKTVREALSDDKLSELWERAA